MSWPSIFTAGRHQIRAGGPPVLIAEAGVNHNGSIDRAIDMVRAIAEAGIPYVKFQTFRAETLVAIDAPKGDYQKETTGAGGSQHEMLRALELGEEAFGLLARECRRVGIDFLSTPFDEESADLLESLHMPLFKLSSADLTNVPFLAHVARKRRPMILSTGMAEMDEVEEAVEICREAGCPALALLQCVSAYPSAPGDCNLRAMQAMSERFELPVGFSDHTVGNHVALAAVARGACIIEKHFTLDRGLPGPDHRASAEVAQLAELWPQMLDVHSSLGTGLKRPTAVELANRNVARRSLCWRVSLPEGAVLEASHVLALRPDGGLPPRALPGLIGRRLARSVERGGQLCAEDFVA